MGALLWLVGVAFVAICINMWQEWPRYHKPEVTQKDFQPTKENK